MKSAGSPQCADSFNHLTTDKGKGRTGGSQAKHIDSGQQENGVRQQETMEAAGGSTEKLIEAQAESCITQESKTPGDRWRCKARKNVNSKNEKNAYSRRHEHQSEPSRV